MSAISCSIDGGNLLMAVSAAVRSISVSSGNQRWQHLQPQSQPLARQHQFQQ